MDNFKQFLNKIKVSEKRIRETGLRKNVYITKDREKTWAEIKAASGKAGVGSYICEMWEELKKYLK